MAVGRRLPLDHARRGHLSAPGHEQARLKIKVGSTRRWRFRADDITTVSRGVWKPGLTFNELFLNEGENA